MMTKFSQLLLTGGALAALGIAAPALAQDPSHTHHHQGTTDAPWSQADAYFGPEEMAASRAHVLHHHGNDSYGMIMMDRAEIQFSDDGELGVWDGAASYGGDINRLMLTTEGEYSFDHEEFEDAEIQLLWSRAISTYFDAQAGLRYDIEPDGLAHAVLGFQGLAPYWFEVSGAAYLSEEGDLTADFEAEYELFLTQRLILQPRAELSLAAQDIPERSLGSGFTNIEAGLRLRYEIRREFAPYIGVEYHSALGSTSDLLDLAGEDMDQTVWVIGLRSWF